MTADGACSSLPPIPAKVSSPNDSGHSGWAAGTGLHAPQPTFDSDGPTVCSEADWCPSLILRREVAP